MELGSVSPVPVPFQKGRFDHTNPGRDASEQVWIYPLKEKETFLVLNEHFCVV